LHSRQFVRLLDVSWLHSTVYSLNHARGIDVVIGDNTAYTILLLSADVITTGGIILLRMCDSKRCHESRIGDIAIPKDS
jgi:hypothetical protein